MSAMSQRALCYLRPRGVARRKRRSPFAANLPLGDNLRAAICWQRRTTVFMKDHRKVKEIPSVIAGLNLGLLYWIAVIKEGRESFNAAFGGDGDTVRWS
jgi:hypothetical protein